MEKHFFSFLFLLSIPKSRTSDFAPHEEKIIRIKNPYYEDDFTRIEVAIKESEMDYLEIRLYDGNNELLEPINLEANSTFGKFEDGYYYQLYSDVGGKK